MEKISCIQHAINRLEDTKVTLNGNFYPVKHIMLLIMVGGKNCNYASENKSTMGCIISGAILKDIGNLKITNEI